MGQKTVGERDRRFRGCGSEASQRARVKFISTPLHTLLSLGDIDAVLKCPKMVNGSAEEDRRKRAQKGHKMGSKRHQNEPQNDAKNDSQVTPAFYA